MRTRLTWLPLTLLAAGAAPGCGYSPAKSAEPATVEDFQRELERASGRLDDALGHRGGRSAERIELGGVSSEQPATPPPPPEPATDAPEEAAGEATASSTAPADELAEASPCETACKALASMARSAERICAMTTDQDARCTQARTRVETATTRVQEAGCVCDAGD